LPVLNEYASLTGVVEPICTLRPPIAHSFPSRTAAWKWSRAVGMFGRAVQVFVSGS
jgi:hypothetical protein